MLRPPVLWLVASLLVTTRAIAMHANVFIVLGAVQIVATAVILLSATKYSSSYCASHALPDLDLGTETESWIVGDGVPSASIVTRPEEVSSMCLTCGCLLPHEDHGNPEYLTIEGLERSAALNGYDLDTALQNLIKTVDVAKKETGHDHR